jgi:hypothetical protein
MNSPRMRVVASFGDDPEKVELSLPPGAAPEMLAEAAMKPQFQLYGMSVRYSYPDEALGARRSGPGNTLVEVSLPYCLNLPNGIVLNVKTSARPLAVAILSKVWTELADGSSAADFYAIDRVTYHSPGSIQTPNFPEKPELGPNARCRGVNIEWDRDTTGTFRYTRAQIFFDTNHTSSIVNEQQEYAAAEKEAITIALEIVNRVIDVYRLVTSTDYVQRLPAIHVTDLYFAGHNIGSHGASFGHGIRSAVMNRSENEIRRTLATLQSGEDLPIYELLLLDAEASLNSHRFTLSVIHAFQALELRLEDLIRNRLLGAGLSQSAVDARLDTVWRTKDRLKDLLREATGKSLLVEQRALWDTFCTVNDQTRNKLIHAAKDLDETRSREAVEVCRAIIAWLNGV